MDYKQIVMTGVVLIAAAYQSSARAATIETLVMPGPVSSAHAEIEAECSECHAAFSKTLQRDLCLSCHEHKNVLEDQVAGTGFHGRFEPARDMECSGCHIEHEGQDADIVRLDTESFDHSFTDFELSGRHAEVACHQCHTADIPFRETPSACVSCHEKNDSHHGRLGEDCASCHQETGWQTTSFDHEKESKFVLSGAHATVECALCHANQRYQGIPQDCYSCHQINDYHRGQYGKDCHECHQTQNWRETTFDHAQASGFDLSGGHAETACGSCHKGNLVFQRLDSECVSCHLIDDVHQGGNGADCAVCHDSRGWSNASFDHTTETDFELKGAHAALDCQGCHKSGDPDMALDTACLDCHQADDVHQASLGESCARCHQETHWDADILFDHDLMVFPLVGLHAVVPCEACHLTPKFTDTPGDCVDCHGRNDPHQNSLGADCGACHNPNGWLLWEFDHNAATGFVLDGAHADLACRACHEAGDNYANKPATSCDACHREDDVHAGQFGRTCSRCHSTRSFDDIGTF